MDTFSSISTKAIPTHSRAVSYRTPYDSAHKVEILFNDYVTIMTLTCYQKDKTKQENNNKTPSGPHLPV